MSACAIVVYAFLFEWKLSKIIKVYFLSMKYRQMLAWSRKDAENVYVYRARDGKKKILNELSIRKCRSLKSCIWIYLPSGHRHQSHTSWSMHATTYNIYFSFNVVLIETPRTKQNWNFPSFFVSFYHHRHTWRVSNTLQKHCFVCTIYLLEFIRFSFTSTKMIWKTEHIWSDWISNYVDSKSSRRCVQHCKTSHFKVVISLSLHIFDCFSWHAFRFELKMCIKFTSKKMVHRCWFCSIFLAFAIRSIVIDTPPSLLANWLSFVFLNYFSRDNRKN